MGSGVQDRIAMSGRQFESRASSLMPQYPAVSLGSSPSFRCSWHSPPPPLSPLSVLHESDRRESPDSCQGFSFSDKRGASIPSLRWEDLKFTMAFTSILLPSTLCSSVVAIYP